jgi:hypothetical protein
VRPLRPLLLTALVAAGLALGACGSGTVSSDEPKSTPPLTVPRTPGDTAGRILVNPSETAQSGSSTTETTSTTTSGGTTTTTAPSTSTPAPTQTTPQQSGGQPAPGGQTGGGTQTTQQTPSGGTPAQQFQDFCKQNPGAC